MRSGMREGRVRKAGSIYVLGVLETRAIASV